MDERKITTSSTQIPGANAPVANVQDTRRTAGDNDRVSGPQMHPVLGGVVVEREQLVKVAGDLRDGLGELRPVSSLERPGRGPGVVLVLGAPNLSQGLLRPRMRRLRQRRQHVGGLVEPAPALPGLGEHLPGGLPEPQRPVTDGQHRGAHAAAGAIAQQVRPRLRRLAVPISEGDQLLAAVGADADHDQQAQLVLLQPDVHVDPVGPQVDVVHPGQVPLGEGTLLRLPGFGEPGDHRRRQAR